VISIKKTIILSALLVVMVFSALPVSAAQLPLNLGPDHVNMTWWIVNAAVRDDGTPFAITRRFFTNETLRQEIIEILITREGVDPEIAGTLFGTEFEYIYSQDRGQFAVVRVTHFSQPRIGGNLIFETIFDNSREGRMIEFQPVVQGHAVGRALALIPR